MCSPSCAIQDGASFVLLSNSSSVPDCYHYGFRNLGALCGFTSVCPSYVLASVLGQDGAVHQSHSSPSQQTSSSVSRFPWRLNLASGTAAVFQEGPYLHKKRTRILVLVAQQVRRSHVALNIFMNSSSLQLWSIYLELMQPLPVFLLCIHLCKGLISSWMMPVTTLTLKQVMKIKFSLMWIFFITILFWFCVAPEIFLSNFSQLRNFLSSRSQSYTNGPYQFGLWTLGSRQLNFCGGEKVTGRRGYSKLLASYITK